MSKQNRSGNLGSPAINGKASDAIPHESGRKHVSGTATYVDDMPLLQDQLFAYIGCSEKARARIKSIDLEAVRSAAGVVAVLTAEDIPGDPHVGPILHDEPLLAHERVDFMGQPIFVVAATSYNCARKAATMAKVDYEEETPVLTIDDALQVNSTIFPDKIIERGQAEAAIKRAPRLLRGKRYMKGQEHFYLEGQISRAVPTEDGGVVVYPSSQHANEIQSLTAKILNIPMNHVTVEVRRAGGAFGGKESPATPFACLSALLAYKLQRPVSLRPSRSDDMVMTGKRHDMRSSYTVGFDETGRIFGADITLSARCGYSADLSPAVVERAMLSLDNAYFIENFRITGQFCKTNTPSSTAFRGFGTPQATVTIEGMLDDIACELGMDRMAVREVNFYDDKQRNTTHYHQEVEHNILPDILGELQRDAEFEKRCKAVDIFNSENEFCKKGIALTPLKYGVGYPMLFMNQAGALIHIYTDGSIHLNHGGVEMGQGVLTKIAQIVAEEFQVDIDRIIVSSMRTDKVANAIVSSASFTTDLNGMAALNAARTIKNRLVEFASENFSVPKEDIQFRNNEVIIGDTTLPFAELIQAAFFNRVSLSSTGYFKTPKVHFDMDAAKGRPYFYYVFGAAISEVIIDLLTGEYKVERVDILHDVGRSLNPGIDLGQIEGGFVQGMGWVTTEEIDWDRNGKFLSSSPSTYKIPTAGDVPPVFNARIATDGHNHEDTPFHSKAVGEPPLVLSISVWAALRHAVSSVVDHTTLPQLDVPATPERILFAIEEVQAQKESQSTRVERDESRRLIEA